MYRHVVLQLRKLRAAAIMPAVDPIEANSAFGNERGERWEEQPFRSVGGSGSLSDRCAFDAPGVLCRTTLVLSVAIGCQRCYVSYFHTCVEHSIGGWTYEAHEVHQARGLRGRVSSSRRGTPDGGDGGAIVQERSVSTIGFRRRLSNVERCRQPTGRRL
jgi:hypothetical protein